MAGAASPLAAQTSVWFANVNYESAPLLAPVLLYHASSESGNTMTLGVLGWTLSGEWTAAYGPSMTATIGAEITPLNAHSSNVFYQDGHVDKGPEYRNRTILVRSGVTFRHSDRWTSKLNLVGLYESVSGLDPSLSSFWKHPYVGIEFIGNYNDVRSDDVFRHRWDGVKLSAHIEMMFGSSRWWRADLRIGAGKKIGPLFLRGSGSYLLGNSLNTVSRFLVGGSWDLAGIRPLYGHYYGEYRFDRCVLIGTGIDIRIFGDWEIGARGGYARGSRMATSGEAIRAATTWNGIGYNIGLGFRNSDFRTPIAFAGVTVALFGS